MNAPVIIGADGYNRRRFTVDDVLRMQEAGIIAPDENYELIEGEIVPMNAKSHFHERVKSILFMAMSRSCPQDLIIGVETSIFFSDDTVLEPDISLFPRRLQSTQVKGPDVILAVEVADTTLLLDRKRKAPLYARFGVQELWIVNAQTRVTEIHTGPSDAGWGGRHKVEADAALAHPALPGFSVVLGEED
jgi:Uma2 family endonuclease